jgi:hypothetical protein
VTEGTFWSWLALFLLGAFHGINPGMGWLFAVALGMQERSRRAVWRALLPLGLGHALAVAVVILLAVLVGVMVPLSSLRIPVALILVGMGCHRLFRQCHPRWGGMRVGMAGLTAWSFLMASVHGAGLMVLPVFLNMSAKVQAASCHAVQANAISGPTEGLLATLVHGTGYLTITALTAWIVYEKLGLGLLRKAWFNLDLVWAVALLLTGGLTLLI